MLVVQLNWSSTKFWDAENRSTAILAEQPDPVGWLDPIAPIYQGSGTFSMTTSDSVIGATPPPGSLAASWSGQVDNRNQLTRVNATAIHSDANGNITDDGERIYYWDAEQRLYGILDKKTNRGTVFIYDGLGRRVREYDADLTRGALDLAQKADYAWCGSKVCQTRDAWGTTIEMPQGLIREGSPIAYYFHRDHLGSVVDVSQADGGHLARTMYSPYCQKELLSSDGAYVEYAGMRFHESSGLYLTYYRAYDPKLGRWLSRDPIGEAGGLNLYGYVGCRPLSYIDPWGLRETDNPLRDFDISGGIGSAVYGTVWGNGGNSDGDSQCGDHGWLDCYTHCLDTNAPYASQIYLGLNLTTYATTGSSFYYENGVRVATWARFSGIKGAMASLTTRAALAVGLGWIGGVSVGCMASCTGNVDNY